MPLKTACGKWKYIWRVSHHRWAFWWCLWDQHFTSHFCSTKGWFQKVDGTLAGDHPFIWTIVGIHFIWTIVGIQKFDTMFAAQNAGKSGEYRDDKTCNIAASRGGQTGLRGSSITNDPSLARCLQILMNIDETGYLAIFFVRFLCLKVARHRARHKSTIFQEVTFCTIPFILLSLSHMPHLCHGHVPGAHVPAQRLPICCCRSSTCTT